MYILVTCCTAYLHCITIHLHTHSQLKGLDENAVIAGYVLSQDGKKWNRMWYQIKRDFVLYKFRAHEVRLLMIYLLQLLIDHVHISNCKDRDIN